MMGTSTEPAIPRSMAGEGEDGTTDIMTTWITDRVLMPVVIMTLVAVQVGVTVAEAVMMVEAAAAAVMEVAVVDLGINAQSKRFILVYSVFSYFSSSSFVSPVKARFACFFADFPSDLVLGLACAYSK